MHLDKTLVKMGISWLIMIESLVLISCLAARLQSNGPKGSCCNQGGVTTEALTVFSPSLVHKYPPVDHFLSATVEIPFEALPNCFDVCLYDLRTLGSKMISLVTRRWFKSQDRSWDWPTAPAPGSCVFTAGV